MFSRGFFIFFHFSFEIESCHICQLHLCHFQIRNYPYMLFIANFFCISVSFLPICFCVYLHYFCDIAFVFIFISMFYCIAPVRLCIGFLRERERYVVGLFYCSLKQSVKWFCWDLLCFCLIDRKILISGNNKFLKIIKNLSKWLSKNNFFFS